MARWGAVNPDLAVKRARRREQSRYMPEIVTIRRATETPDGAGGTKTVWADVTQPPSVLDANGNLRGRVDPAGGTPEERVIADRITAQTPYTITVAHGADVGSADRLVVAGITYEVVGVITGSWTPNPKVVCTRQE